MKKKGKSNKRILKSPIPGTGMSVLLVLIAIAFVSLVVTPVMAQQAEVKAATTAASEIYEPGPLDVFGNANEDDTIDMRDTTYIKLAIFGKKQKTDLADANYDGKVSMLDVGQTKLIILGKEKELTFIDLFGEAETVNKPIKRLIFLSSHGLKIMRALNAKEIMLPVVGSSQAEYSTFYPEVSKWPAIKDDYEMMLSLEPDALVLSADSRNSAIAGPEKKRLFKEKLPDIPIISRNMREIDVLPRSVRTFGYILDRDEEAEEFSEWIEGYLNEFKDLTEGLSEDEKPRYYYESHGKRYYAVVPGSRFDLSVALAGGRNIMADTIGPDSQLYGKSGVDIDPEWVVIQNPEYILSPGRVAAGYETDDISIAVALVQEIMNRPELAKVDAVKNKHVYLFGRELAHGGGNSIIGIAYMGKVFHPDLFKDIDPQAIHQEYVDRFQHIDFNVKEHGVFFYPPLK